MTMAQVKLLRGGSKTSVFTLTSQNSCEILKRGGDEGK